MNLKTFKNIFEEQKESGLNQRKFSASIEMNYSVYCYWVRKLKKETLPISEKNTFLEISDIKNRSINYELRTPRGLVVSIPSDFDSISLSRLLKVVSESC